MFTSLQIRLPTPSFPGRLVFLFFRRAIKLRKKKKHKCPITDGLKRGSTLSRHSILSVLLSWPCLETLVGMLSYIFVGLAFFRIAYATVIATRQAQGQNLSILSDEDIEVFKPYSFYSAAAYCSPSDILTWSCGGRCHRLTLKNIWQLIYGLSSCVGFPVDCVGNPDFQPLASGGDGNAVQYCSYHNNNM